MPIEIDRVCQLLNRSNARIIDRATIKINEEPEVIQRVCDRAKKAGLPEELVKILKEQGDVLHYLLDVSIK